MVDPKQAPPPSQPNPTLDGDGETAGAAGQKRQQGKAPPATQPAATKPAPVEQFGRLVVDPTKLASDDDLAKLPRTKLWDELTKGKPPRIDPDDATKLHPGTKAFLQSLDCVHYPGDSGMLAIYDKNNYGGTKPILDLTAGNIVAIHKEGDVNDPNYLKSTDHLDAVLKGAALSKMTNQPPGTPKNQATVVIDTPATESGGQPSLSKLIMAYAAEKTGLHAVGSDGNKIDTSALPADVKKQMDTEWDKMKGQYGFVSPTEAFNPAAKGTPPPGPAPAAAPAPTTPLSAQDIGQKAIDNATKRFGDGPQKTDVKLGDANSVREAVGTWAEKLTHSDNPAVKAAASDLLGKMHDGTLQGKDLVGATNDFQNALVKAGYKMDAGTPDGAMIEDISMATQAYAAKTNTPGVDPKVYHAFQPDDGLTKEQVGIAPPPTSQPPAPAVAPKQ